MINIKVNLVIDNWSLVIDNKAGDSNIRTRLEKCRHRITSRVPPGTTLDKEQGSNVLLT